MLGKLVVRAKIFTVQKCGSEVGHLLFESARQNRQTHDLDQTDVFLLDVVQLLMRMIEAHRMFWCGQVVAQHQIQFVLAISHSGNRRDRVVRLAVGFREDHRVGVRIAAPLGENFARQLAELVFIFRRSTVIGYFTTQQSTSSKPGTSNENSDAAFSIGNV